MEKILNEYDQKQAVLIDFKSKVELLLFNLLKTNNVNYHHITSRKKDKESVARKLEKKQDYTCLDDMTDVIGCRIITYFEDDVDHIASIIEREFEIDPENSVDKRKVEFDRFGYQSLHYVALLNKNRSRLTEYKQFKKLKFEIQIRSILQHSWAEIEHDIGYKGKYSIPDIAKRRFSRIAALLETADLEFVALRNELASYEKNIKKEISENPANVRLDKASLKSFISSDKNLKLADASVAKLLNITLKPSNALIDNILPLLEFSGLKTIFDLQTIYHTKFKCIIDFADKYREHRNPANKKGEGVNGISLYDLTYMLVASKKSRDELQLFFETNFKKHFKDSETRVNEITVAFNKIAQNCR